MIITFQLLVCCLLVSSTSFSNEILSDTCLFTTLKYLLCVHSGMKSTGCSIEPCLSWTAQWREMKCYATKPNRGGNRETERGGRDRKQKQRRVMLLTQRRQGWMLTRFTTRCSALSAPQRWPYLIKMRSTTSSTFWPATAETNWANSEQDSFHLQSVCLWLLVSAVAAFKAAVIFFFFFFKP